jgi:hypothetical protein
MLWPAFLHCSRAADCNAGQPRQEGDPSAQRIGDELTSSNNIDSVCSGSWWVGDAEQLENTYNYWGESIQEASSWC